MHQGSPTQNYLRKENQDLRFQVQELKDILELNKQALRKTIKTDSKDIKELLKMLYAQNDKLRDRLNKSYDDFSMINSTMLIGEQIVIATESHEKKLIEQLLSKTQSLKQDLRQKQRKISQLEKFRLVQEKTGMVVKTTFITTPNFLQMKHHDQIQMLNRQLSKKQDELQRQKQRNDDLFRMNVILNKQILDNKIPATTVTSGKKFSDFQELLQTHQQFRNSDSQSSYNSSIHSQQQKQQKNHRLSTIPKLQLSKAKQIQELIVKKINMKDKKKQKSSKINYNSEEKTQLQKQLKEQKLKNFLNQRKISKQNRIIKQLEQRNRLLVDTKVNNYEQDNILAEPSNQYLQELEIRHMLEVAKDVYLNDVLERIINEEVYVDHRDGSLSA